MVAPNRAPLEATQQLSISIGKLGRQVSKLSFLRAGQRGLFVRNCSCHQRRKP